MRKRQPCLFLELMMLLCLLCACGGKGTSALEAPTGFRAALLSAGGCAFQAAGSVDWGQTALPFSLDCALSENGDGRVTVTAPESVAGISAVLKDGAAALAYDGTVLGLPDLPGELAPLRLPGLLVRAWSCGYIAGAGTDGDALCVQYELGEGPDALTVYTWFDETDRPLRGELYYKNNAVALLTLDGFSLTAGGTDETAETNLGERVPGQSEP